VVEVLKDLGGSGRPDEVRAMFASRLAISEQDLHRVFAGERNARPKLTDTAEPLEESSPEAAVAGQASSNHRAGLSEVRSRRTRV
jgi:hypothetical protein